jgi:hypothetical protein
MTPRTWNLPGPPPHCPLCACDLEVVQFKTLAGDRVAWVCQCSPETLRLLHTDGLAAPARAGLDMFPLNTATWRDAQWRHYYRCQRVRDLDRLPV